MSAAGGAPRLPRQCRTHGDTAKRPTIEPNRTTTTRPAFLGTPGATTLALLSLVALAHLLAMRSIGLSGDAAHYALYGAYPAWSYFDHPPLIGWMQALVEQFTTSNLGLRLWPLALMLASSAVLYRFARELFPEESPWLGFNAVLVLQSGIIFMLMGMSMLPDDPLLLFFLLSARALYRTITLDQARGWLWVGLWFGLAGLSKYTAVTLVASAGVLMISERRWSQLRTPWPWLAILIALAVISPVLWWNWQHAWISFRYQVFHVDNPHSSWSLQRFLISEAIQFLAYSPGIYLFGLASAVLALRGRSDPRMRLLLAIAAPVLILLDASSGLRVSLPHWTAVGWAVLSIPIAYWLGRYWNAHRWLRIGTYLSAGYSLLLGAAILSQLAIPWLPFKADHNPLADLYGWQQAAQTAETLRAEQARTPGTTPVLFAGDWSYASHLAWYAYPTPVQITTHRVHQMNLWYGTPRKGARGILVVPYQFRGQVSSWRAKFAHCALAQKLPIDLHGEPATTYFLYRCRGYHG